PVWERVVAVATCPIGLLSLPMAISLLRDVGRVSLEATPENVDLAEVREHMLALPCVVDVHDLHAWTITSGVPVLSAHVVVDADEVDYELGCRTLDALDDCLDGHFDVAHCTFQLEPVGHVRHEQAVHH